MIILWIILFISCYCFCMHDISIFYQQSLTAKPFKKRERKKRSKTLESCRKGLLLEHWINSCTKLIKLNKNGITNSLLFLHFVDRWINFWIKIYDVWLVVMKWNNNCLTKVFLPLILNLCFIIVYHNYWTAYCILITIVIRKTFIKKICIFGNIKRTLRITFLL